MKNLFFCCLLLVGTSQLLAQADQPPALEGGKGFIQTQAASLYGTGYLGFGLTGVYTSVKIENISGREQLMIAAVNLTYDVSDELEFRMELIRSQIHLQGLS